MANSIFDIGVGHGNSKDQRKQIRNTNIYAFCTFIFAIVLAVYLSFYDANLTVKSLTLLVPAIVPFVLNYLGLFSISRFVYVVLFSWFLTSLHAYLLVEETIIVQLIILQFVAALLPWVIIDSREKSLLIVTLVFSYLIFLSFPWINEIINASNQSEVVAEPFFRNLFLILSLVLSVVFMLQLQMKGLRAEEKNKALFEELNNKNSELEQQESELQKTLDEIHVKHKEDEKRSWSSNGTTMINRVLRSAADENLYHTLSSELVKYMKGYQGGIYILEGTENEEQYLTLYGSYAFPYEKVQKKTFSIDEGYLGQACFERAKIYLEEIPEDYEKIQSALGESTPVSMLMMPMIQEGQLEGVMELAFLRKLEQYEIDFVEEAATILARFIENHQVNTKTRQLLEDTQQQTEEMRAQEEEMRQNMEELQATQEEMRRKESEYLKKIEELENQLNN